MRNTEKTTEQTFEGVDDNGFKNTLFYVDDGFSGTNFNRPDFMRMIADVESGKVGIVITKDLSRLGRDYLLTGQYIEMVFPDFEPLFCFCLIFTDGYAIIRQ